MINYFSISRCKKNKRIWYEPNWNLNLARDQWKICISDERWFPIIYSLLVIGYNDWSKISIKLAAAELQLSEKINVRQEETKAYPFTAFLADTGGALGLFLGLSILQIFQWIGSLWPNTIKLLKYTYAQILFIQRVIL